MGRGAVVERAAAYDNGVGAALRRRRSRATCTLHSTSRALTSNTGAARNGIMPARQIEVARPHTAAAHQEKLHPNVIWFPEKSRAAAGVVLSVNVKGVRLFPAAGRWR